MMSVQEKLQTIAENDQRLYEMGRTKEWSDFWDVFQNYGNPMQYIQAFARNRFNANTYKPKHPFKSTYSTGMFQGLNFTDTLVDIELLEGQKDASYMFGYCSKLKTIRKIKISTENISFSTSAFQSCSALENITFEGVIPCNIHLQWSTKLTHDSLMSVINALKDYSEDTSGTEHLLQIGDTNIAKLTQEEIEIITQKGWVYK